MNQDIIKLDRPLAEKGLLYSKDAFPLKYALIRMGINFKFKTMGTRLCLKRI